MNDEDLRRRFGELRKEDAKLAPPFAQVAGRRPRPKVHALYAIVPAFAAAAALLLWCGTRDASAPPRAVMHPPPRVSPVAAALPLDFLLESAPARVRLDADPIQGLRP